MAYLILIRHGQSEWNEKGLWTGWTDIPLNQRGHEEAIAAARKIKDLKIDAAFTSKLKRAKETLDEIKKTLGINPPTIEAEELNERNYGIYTGKNKWEIKKEIGDEKFLQIRRSWDYPIIEGESLKDVYARVVPYFQTNILPILKEGKNVLISAHGNSIRALIKFLENVPDSEISKIELSTGEIYIYKLDEKGNIINKEIKSAAL